MRKVIAKEKNDDLGSIHSDEVLLLRIAGRRLGWSKKSIIQAKRAGLKSVRFGHCDFVLGKWLWEFIEKLGESQHQ